MNSILNKMLESLPQNGGKWAPELLEITRELFQGYRLFADLEKPAVSIFGSARFKQDHPYCVIAKECGFLSAKAGFTVITGAGPGIMEAASEGAKEAGGKTLGANIVVPHEQRPNPYVDKHFTFKNFFTRKVMLTEYSDGFIIFPGGFGTLDELVEILNLMATNKLKKRPLVLIGTSYWKNLLAWLKTELLEAKTIDPSSLEMIHLVDDAVKAVEFIQSK